MVVVAVVVVDNAVEDIVVEVTSLGSAVIGTEGGGEGEDTLQLDTIFMATATPTPTRRRMTMTPMPLFTGQLKPSLEIFLLNPESIENLCTIVESLSLPGL